MKVALGIDEAGRGPVVGPMVIAVVAARKADRRWFARLAVRDSKIIPAAERTTLALRIKERCWYRLAVVHPPAIDAAVRDRTRTLNGLERELMSDLLKEARQTFPEDEMLAYIDAPDINAERFGDTICKMSQWTDRTAIRAMHNADQKHRIVGAASIIAKDERERLMRALREELGKNVGCGYPHDPLTRAFVQTCAPNSPHVRWTWKTARICWSKSEVG